MPEKVALPIKTPSRKPACGTTDEESGCWAPKPHKGIEPLVSLERRRSSTTHEKVEEPYLTALRTPRTEMPVEAWEASTQTPRGD